MREPRVVQLVVGAEVSTPAGEDLAAFLARTAREAAGSTPLARAVAAALTAERLGFAFAAGYRAALARLAPDFAAERLALAATEHGGAHPRAIGTSLAPAGDGFALTGKKRWVTL
ncbi:MAG TPA: hypothetical protein VHB21_01865, partial [Minicystis sp.]|nr:hypothetical protein [Minicystis sp.]